MTQQWSFNLNIDTQRSWFHRFIFLHTCLPFFSFVKHKKKEEKDLFCEKKKRISFLHIFSLRQHVSNEKDAVTISFVQDWNVTIKQYCWRKIRVEWREKELICKSIWEDDLYLTRPHPLSRIFIDTIVCYDLSGIKDRWLNFSTVLISMFPK